MLGRRAAAWLAQTLELADKDGVIHAKEFVADTTLIKFDGVLFQRAGLCSNELVSSVPIAA